MKTVYRGEVYYAELSPVIGSEQGGIRPVLILQNNTGQSSQPHYDHCAHHLGAEEKLSAHTHRH